MKIAIFIADSNGAFSVPASKGGAVSTLVEHLVSGANQDNSNKLTIYTYYEEKAFEESKKYKNVNFIWVKRNLLIKFLDRLVFKFINTFFKKKKALSFASIASLAWYILYCSFHLRKTNYDKVVLENNIPIAWIIKLSKFKGDFYYHFHNVPRVNAGCKSIFSSCKRFLCVSEYVGKQIELRSNPIGPVAGEKIRILYNCIDTELFKPKDHYICREKLITKFKLPVDKKIIVFVGRLSPEKGIDILLKACKVYLKDYVVLIVGSYIQGVSDKDTYGKELLELASEMPGRVFFTGYINQGELPEVYSGADIAVLPSKWDEPAGLTMVEATMCGVSLVTTKSGGIPEYIENDLATFVDRNENLTLNIAREVINYDYKKKLNPGDSKYFYLKNKFGIEQYYLNFIRIISE